MVLSKVTHDKNIQTMWEQKLDITHNEECIPLKQITKSLFVATVEVLREFFWILLVYLSK